MKMVNIFKFVNLKVAPGKKLKILASLFIACCFICCYMEKLKYDGFNAFNELEERIERMAFLERSNRDKMMNFCQKFLNAKHKNMPGLQICLSNGYSVAAPYLYSRLPHIAHHHGALQPIIVHSKNKDRELVRVVMGMASVMRGEEGYLFNTLASLLQNLRREEEARALIVILITELAQKDRYISHVKQRLLQEFPRQMDEGLIEIVAPNDNFYPPLNNYTTLGDKLERMRWRTKQNLDYIYLMLYCRNRGSYYLQLEDDIIAAPDYFSKMNTFILKYSTKPWFVLEFSKMGFIGKLFNEMSLDQMIIFLLMFYDDKPGDWLLINILEMLSPCEILYGCKLKWYRMNIQRSLFQHIGVKSSLTGKIQKIKAKDFIGKTVYFVKHPSGNPEATMQSSLHQASKFGLQDIYDFHSFEKQFYFKTTSNLQLHHILIEFAQPVSAQEMIIEGDDQGKHIIRDAILEASYANSTSKSETFVPVIYTSTENTTNILFKISPPLVRTMAIQAINISFVTKVYYELEIKSIDIILDENTEHENLHFPNSTARTYYIH